VYETKGKSARCLVIVGAASTAKASSGGWRLRLRPNTMTSKKQEMKTFEWIIFSNPLKARGLHPPVHPMNLQPLKTKC
jgi:hypothetical protein